MVFSKCVSTKQQYQQQVNPDDEGEDDLNIADDATQHINFIVHDKHRSIVVMEKPRKKREINKVKDLPYVNLNNISILEPNWHKIEEKEKELLWLDIKKRREEARAQALKQTNRTRVGAKGFTGFEEKWEEERNDPNKATDLHKIPSRGSNFCLGRRRLDKDGNLTVPPEIVDIANKLGVSSIVGYKKGLTGYVRKKMTYKQSLDFKELSEKVQEKLLSGELLEKVQEKLFFGPVWNRVKEKMLEELMKEPIIKTGSVGPTTSNIRIYCIKVSKKRKKTVKAPIQQSKVEKEKADIKKRLHMLKEDIDLRLEAVKNGYYRWMDCKDCAMPQFVNFKKEIFLDAHDFTLPRNATDKIKLLAGDKLRTNILTLFSSNDGSSVIIAIIADSVLLLLLIRCGQHVLLIICPKHERGFILDSFKWEKKKTKEDYYLVSQVERVVGHLSWELPIVSLQEDTWECGFYVMKWVLDFVLKYQHDNFLNIQPWGETRSPKISEMDDVVTAWFLLWRETDL
nr:ulp1 protease family, C-terminal catalytic domain-containing protein [Tanacetum cinerariifolium]